MPPQGESTGIYIEDAIVFGRIMMQHTTKPIPSIMKAYERFRHPHTDKAVTEATFRWSTAKNQSRLTYQLIVWSTSWYLWWTAKAREAELAKDFSKLEIEVVE